MSEKMSLKIRCAELDDAEKIHELIKKAYPLFPPYPLDMLRAQITNFPEGHFVAILNDKIVGYSASIRISGEKALAPHTWREITGGGYGATHEEHGDYLYGYEVCVDPEVRGYRIGQRFYNERKKLCRYYRLKAIVFAGRIPNIKKRLKQAGTVENYIKMVRQKKMRDPVLSFQLRNGFEVLGVFKNYLPTDEDSLGYGVHLIWKNPAVEDSSQKKKKKKDTIKDTPSGLISPSSLNNLPKKNSFNRQVTTVRVAAVQYRQRKIKSFEEFKQFVKYFVDVVSDYNCDFVLFPELFTLQLLSVENEAIEPSKAIIKISQYEKKLDDFFNKLAIRYNINIIAGSQPVLRDDKVQNVSKVFLRDGNTFQQAKIHPTPNEKYWWNIEGGSQLMVIPTDCGPIGILVCYDSEFPELGRHLVNQGMRILFVPFLTDEKQSYWRVRYCAHARAIENQVYVVMAGSVGNLPNVHNMDIHYAQSCILTPCDFPFARDGIAADTTPNVETVAIADLRIDDLVEARNAGTVQNLKDRRHDLYSVKWYPKEK